MFKLCVLLQRRPEVSVSEFRHWWLEHVEMSRQIPGLRGYRINFVNGLGGVGFNESEMQFDGTAELWFDSLEDMKKGFNSPIGQRAGEDAERHCAKRVRFFTEEHVIL